MADSPNAGKVGEWKTPAELAKELHVGDLVETDRGPFSHWGVSMGNYEGNAIVIHVTGDVMSGLGAVVGKRGAVADIRVEDLLSAVGSSPCRFNNKVDETYAPLAKGEEIVKRGLAKLGEHDYSMWANNCEHWASWCRNGHMLSQQVVEKEMKLEELKAGPKAKLDGLKAKLDELKSKGPPQPPPLPGKVEIPADVLEKMPFLKKFDQEKLE